MPGINALLLGYLMYRSGLVPRLIPVLGLIGAPLLIASAIAAFFRGDHQVTALAAVATVPIFLWELSLGLWLVIKGFKPSPITAMALCDRWAEASQRSCPGAQPNRLDSRVASPFARRAGANTDGR